MISCTPTDLANAAKCLPCLPSEVSDAVEIYLLCAWANGGAAPQDQGYLLTDDGGFILLNDGSKILIQL